MKDLRTLSDLTLLSETKLAVARERESTSEVLRHLKEVDRRRLYCGNPSLHEYTVHELKYTDDEAQRRISAMRTLREVPEIEERVMSGELSMTHIGIARSIFYSEKKQGRAFTPEKKREVFEAMAGKSTREAKRVALAFAEETPARPDEIKPLKDGLNQFKGIFSDETLAKIEKMKGRLAHKNPNPSMDELVSAVFDIALEATDPAKEPKRKVKAATKVSIKRAVWKRDEGVCVECGSAYAVQEDHKVPKSLGGPYTLENMRLLCRNCNQRAAIEKLGQDVMDPYLSPAAPRAHEEWIEDP